MHAWVWVVEHNGCGVVSRNVGRLINGKWEIDVISLRNGVGSDWNGRGISGLDANGIDSDVTGNGIAGGNGDKQHANDHKHYKVRHHLSSGPESASKPQSICAAI
jgi:hypothetical protein